MLYKYIDFWDIKAIIYFHDLMPDLSFIAPLWRHKLFWIPLYMFLFVWISRKYGFWKVVEVLVISLLVVGVSDFISAQVLKPAFQRLRPCHVDWLAQHIHVLVPCGAGYSFPSAHATNHIALAYVLSHYLSRWASILLYLWAISIGIMQVYVGVHFFSDVLAGFILGFIIAFVIFRIARYIINLYLNKEYEHR